MYYYIFDIRQCKNKPQAEKIKDYLAELGISGEFVYPSQARTAKELVNDALERNFSTIVAIGNDSLVSEVASELCGEKAAFGIIPLNASESINRIVNGNDWRQAATNLRYRKIKEVRLGKFENGQHFLTSTHLAITSPVNVTLEFDDYIAQARAKRLTISILNPAKTLDQSNHLDIFFTAESPSETTIIGKFIKLFESPQRENSIKDSMLHAKRLRVFSHKKLDFVVNHKPIAQTPQLITIGSKFLRLIVNRDFIVN